MQPSISYQSGSEASPRTRTLNECRKTTAQIHSMKLRNAQAKTLQPTRLLETILDNPHKMCRGRFAENSVYKPEQKVQSHGASILQSCYVACILLGSKAQKHGHAEYRARQGD